MSSFCTNCGAPSAEDVKFCTSCGAKTREAPAQQPAQAAPAQQPAQTAPAQQPSQAAPAQAATYQQQAAAVAPGAAPAAPAYNNSAAADVAPPKGSQYAPISTLGYVGWMILMGIPVIGLIIAIILARGNGPVNRRNLARAVLVFFCIGVVVTIAMSVLALTGVLEFNFTTY